MSMLTLAISYLTISYLPWFMDLTFQLPLKYCSLLHRTLLPSSVTSTTRCYFCFSSGSSFLPELFLCSSPVAYCVPTDLGSSSSSVLTFCLFILFMEFSGKNVEVVSHSLLQWTTFGRAEDAERTREQSSWVTWPCICTNAQHVSLVALRGACVNSRVLYELCEEGWDGQWSWSLMAERTVLGRWFQNLSEHIRHVTVCPVGWIFLVR